MMDDAQLNRYSRQIMLPEIDISGQEKLLQARVLIVGMGGLGSPIGLYLAAAGVGHITIVDNDVVDTTNLQRQIAHQQSDVGRSKVDSAKDSMLAINDTIEVKAINHRVDLPQLNELVVGMDLVIDATDNFETRFDINAACVAHKVPAIFGAAVRLEGQILVVDSSSACYRCLYNNASDTALNCAENGVAAPVVGIVGTTQAMEAIRMLTGIGSSAGYLQVLDAQSMEWRKFRLPKQANCPTCSTSDEQ